MIRVAITRALPEAEATAERVRALGAEPILAPLLTIEPRPFDADLNGVQALLFTSAAGVRAFVQASAERRRVLAVGEATARAARDAGFSDVRAADDDSAALAHLAARSLDRGGGKLLHISGAHVAGDLVGALTEAGFTGERRIAYEAVAATALASALTGKLDVVLFHSARAAETFTRLGAPNSAALIAGCLSPAVAKAASISPWKQIVVAPRPREDALLSALLSPTGANA